MTRTVAPTPTARRIAVIGSGIAGMSAAWLLNKSHDVTLYEKSSRIGGHANTVTVPTASGDMPVDTGFIVYNDRNYPNLTALFDHLNVPVKDSEMSFAASLGDGRLEYAGSDINGLLGQRRNIMRPAFWRMVADLMRFYREAPAFLESPEADDMSLGAYLQKYGYGESFIQDHLLPIGAAIWSTSASEMTAYPAAAFIRFFESHGLLSLTKRPQWRTVAGGSREYVQRLTAPYRQKIRFGGAKSIRRAPQAVQVEARNGRVESFDHVVIAAHADEAFALLSDPDPLEQDLLGCWRYTKNRAVLHSDPALMPRRRRVWSSWNFVSGAAGAQDGLCVTYWMNRLQSLASQDPLLVTLNPFRDPKQGSVLYETEYTHPYFDAKALNAQRRLWSLQGHRRTWFCGSYFGHGFHEDALQSGLAVAEQLGGTKRPWSVQNESGRIFLDADRPAVAA